MNEVATVASPDFISIIQTVGFPIACCIALFIYLVKSNKSHKEEVTKLTEAFYEMRSSFAESIAQQNKELTQAINNNTLVMQRLADKLDGGNT